MRSAEHLEPALDRFAQFFIAPLISEDGVEREVKAVDSECATSSPKISNCGSAGFCRRTGGACIHSAAKQTTGLLGYGLQLQVRFCGV